MSDRSDCVAVRYMLDAEASPGLLSRVLLPFAKRDLTPDRVWCHRGGDVLRVEVVVDAMPTGYAHLVEGNLRQIIGVHTVTRVDQPEMRGAA